MFKKHYWDTNLSEKYSNSLIRNAFPLFLEQIYPTEFNTISYIHKYEYNNN